MTASSVSASTSLSGKWSEISTWVRYPRVLPSLIRVFRRERRRARSSSDRTVSSRPNSFISARSLALLIFMRSGLTFSSATAASGTSSTSPSKSASTSDRSVSSLRAGATTVLPGSALWLPATFGLGSRLGGAALVAAAAAAAVVAAAAAGAGVFFGVFPAGAAGLLALAGLLFGKSLAGLVAATFVCSAAFFTGTALPVLAAGAVGAGAGFLLAAFAGAAGVLAAGAADAFAAGPGADLGGFADFSAGMEQPRNQKRTHGKHQPDDAAGATATGAAGSAQFQGLRALRAGRQGAWAIIGGAVLALGGGRWWASGGHSCVVFHGGPAWVLPASLLPITYLVLYLRYLRAPWVCFRMAGHRPAPGGCPPGARGAANCKPGPSLRHCAATRAGARPRRNAPDRRPGC